MENHNSHLQQENEIEITVSPELSGKRLDLLIAGCEQCSHLSRSRVQSLIRSGNVLVDGIERKTGYKVRENEHIQIIFPPAQPSSLVPQDLDFEILYEDEDLVVLSKPPGLVVHPSHGHTEGTLVHGLLHHCQDLSGIGGEERPGIVHRLDKDTSGVMVVAKNDLAHSSLVDQFKSRSVEKRYLAILRGLLPQKIGRIEAAIGRHPVHRKKMSVLQDAGRKAVTEWEVLETFNNEFVFVKLRLETGRTHQIRVHMASLGCPVAGDELYGKARKQRLAVPIVRQCLHSHKLTFTHPRIRKRLSFEAPIWSDMENVLQFLRNKEHKT